MSRRVLAVFIVVATVITWGGRIGLLDGRADWLALTRIFGSIVIGLMTAFVLFVADQGSRPAVRHLVGIVFSGWTSVVWLASLVSVWSTPNSNTFRLVHTILAAVWLSLAWMVWRNAQTGSGRGTITSSAASTSSTDR